MGARPSKVKAESSQAPPTPRWAALTPKLLLHVFRRLSSHGDRVRFASVCRQWRHVSKPFMRWSDLPPEIADLVIRRLPAQADHVRFASVCRHWHDIACKFWSPWSCLPSELASLVLRRLVYSHADRIRFATVCCHWRYVARQYSPPLPPALPWICSGSGTYQSLPDGELHSPRLSKQEEVCYGCFGNWLLLKEMSGNQQRFLENPLSGATIRLPTHCKEPVFQNFHDSHDTISDTRSVHFEINKIIMCTGDIIAALVSCGYHSKAAVVCCRPGMSSWSLGFYNGNLYKDMVFYMGNLYTVANGGDLFVHEVTEDRDTGEPKVSRINE